MKLSTHTINHLQALGLGVLGYLVADQVGGVGTTIYIWAVALFIGVRLHRSHEHRKRPWVVLGLGLLTSLGFAISEDPWVILISYLSIGVTWWALAVSLSTTQASYLGFILAPFSLLRRLISDLVGLYRSMLPKSQSSYGRVKLVITGLVFSVIPVLIFGLLFSAADQRFDELVSDLSFDVITDLLAHIYGIALFTVPPLLAIAINHFKSSPFKHIDMPAPQTSIAVIAGMLPIVLVFASYIFVQSTYFFGGEKLIQDTDNLTFATYAREGFGALVWVSIFCLPLLAWLLKRSEYALSNEKPLLVAISVSLVVMLMVIEASAIYRMALYIDAYRLSIQRIMASWFMGFVITATALYLVSLLSKSRKYWLPNVSIAWLVFNIALVVMSPSKLVAVVNVANDEGQLDYGYFQHLKQDAWPVLVSEARQRSADEDRCMWLTNLYKPKQKAWYEQSFSAYQANQLWVEIEELQAACPKD